MMAKTRKEKNKQLYDDLAKEMNNIPGNTYEEKLKSLDPSLNSDDGENFGANHARKNKKIETNNNNILGDIAKEINGKKEKKHELVRVEEETKELENKEDDELFTDPISFTDKLSVEEILRAKIEKQQKLKSAKKGVKKSPVTETYTAEMIQERIKQHEGIDVRKEVRLRSGNYSSMVMFLLVFSLLVVIALGVLIIFKVIQI